MRARIDDDRCLRMRFQSCHALVYGDDWLIRAGNRRGESRIDADCFCALWLYCVTFDLRSMDKNQRAFCEEINFCLVVVGIVLLQSKLECDADVFEES